MKTVLITGATGLIGKDTIKPLLNEGFIIFAISVTDNNPEIKGVNWITCNLLNATEDELSTIVKRVHPTHLMCLAWCTTGDYLTSTLNELFYYSTLLLIRLAVKHNCKRVVVAGSCFEYDFSKTANIRSIRESFDTVAASNYAYYKLKLLDDATTICKKYNATFAYGRIFYVFGYPSKKFITTMIAKALSNQDIVITENSILNYDYIYSKDAAKALVKILNSKVKGCVNISNEKAVRLSHLAKTIVRLTGSSSNIIVNTPVTPRYNVVGDNFKLINLVGFIPEYTLPSALMEVIEAYKKDNCNV